MKFQKISITPELAAKYLENNPRNRRVKQRQVTLYSNVIKNGDWNEDNPEPIIIAEDGRLLDGQHRLHAIIKANKTLNMWCALGVPESVFSCLNQGASRTHADVLDMSGISNSNLISTGIKQYLGLKAKNSSGRSAETDSIYVDLILNVYKSDPEKWQNMARKVLKWHYDCAGILSKNFILSRYAFLSEIDSSQAEEFFTKLCTGVGIVSEFDPAKLLRDVLMKISHDSYHRSISPIVIHVFFIKAWNSFREKKEIKRLYWKKETEPVPQFI